MIFARNNGEVLDGIFFEGSQGLRRSSGLDFLLQIDLRRSICSSEDLLRSLKNFLDLRRSIHSEDDLFRPQDFKRLKVHLELCTSEMMVRCLKICFQRDLVR